MKQSKTSLLFLFCALVKAESAGTTWASRGEQRRRLPILATAVAKSNSRGQNQVSPPSPNGVEADSTSSSPSLMPSPAQLAVLTVSLAVKAIKLCSAVTAGRECKLGIKYSCANIMNRQCRKYLLAAIPLLHLPAILACLPACS